MAVKLKEIKVGMLAMVRGSFGRDPAIEVIVTGVHADIKNGMAGIDYEISGRNGSGWAYLNQIDSVYPAKVHKDCTNSVSIITTYDYEDLENLCNLRHDDKTGIVCHIINEAFDAVHKEYGEGNIDVEHYQKFRDLELKHA